MRAGQHSGAWPGRGLCHAVVGSPVALYLDLSLVPARGAQPAVLRRVLDAGVDAIVTNEVAAAQVGAAEGHTWQPSAADFTCLQARVALMHCH
jgi:hypothetical protein